MKDELYTEKSDIQSTVDVSTNQTSGNNGRSPSIRKNYIFNLAYQIFLIVVPIITTPYVARVLTSNGVGRYSFSFSLATYFTILAGLGFGYYAQRAIAKCQEDKLSISKTFWEIILCRLLSVAISLGANILLCLLGVYKEYTSLMWVFNINILAIAFDISFLYQGKEEFGSLVLKNFIIKTLAVILIFVFVKNENSIIVYALINASSVFLANVFMWVSAKKYLQYVSIRILRPLSHLKGTLVLFLPTIAISIYTVLDKTLIGLLVPGTYETIDSDGLTVVKKISDLENGYYEQSEKIVKMAMVVITSLGTVMIPRNSSEIERGNYDKVRQNITKSCQIVLLFGIPIMLGLIVVADSFVPWFLGEGYDKSALLIKVLAGLVPVLGFSNVFGLQFLIPSGKDKQFTFALLVGALVNLSLNIAFIMLWKSLGAAIASIFAESIVTAIMAFMIRKEINFIKILGSGWKYYISGLVMFGVCFVMSKFVGQTILGTFILILSGVFVYFCFLVLMRDCLIIGFAKRIFKFKKKQ